MVEDIRREYSDFQYVYHRCADQEKVVILENIIWDLAHALSNSNTEIYSAINVMEAFGSTKKE